MQRTGIGVGIDGHRANAQGAQGADNAHRDFTAIGDQDRIKKVCVHHDLLGYIRNRPKLVSGTAVRAQTSRARPSTLRVSAGSMTPSSHKRAVE
ncbi:hypothetical protein D3C74_470870 [compost metagenome]